MRISRTTRVIIVMALLLLSTAVGVSRAQAAPAQPAEPAPVVDAGVSACNIEVAARWDYVSNMRVYTCMSVSTAKNMKLWGNYCAWTSIGVSISNVTAYKYSFYSGGKKHWVVGCRYTKSLFWVPGAATTCYIEATYSPKWYGGSVGWGGSIGPWRSNYC